MSTEHLFVTIDGPSTRDIDDAFSLQQVDDGWRLTVAIAAPAAEVEQGSPLDLAARKQAATVYDRTRVVKSMLPLAMSEERCSLLAGVERFAMLITIDLDGQHKASEPRIHFGNVKVAHRLIYEDVPFLATQKGDLGQMMRDAINLSKALLHGRRSAGALAFFDLTKLVYLDEDGALQRATSADDMIGHIVIQEFMVLANTQMARWAIQRELPFIYRSHRPKLAAPPVTDLLESIRTMSQDALSEQLKVIMGTAVYSAHVQGHYALNLPFYCHGTSPLRRYVDLVNQRQALAHCKGLALPHTQDEIAEICLQVNETLAQAKIDRSESFKEVVVNRAAKALDGAPVERLGDPELVQAIKLSASSGGMPGALSSFLARRMAGGGLPDKVLDVMVTAATVIKLPLDLLDAWVSLLSTEPTRAKHFLMFALQTGLASGHGAQDEAIGTSGFAVHVSVRRVSDNAVLNAGARAPRKKDAENMASARLMCQFLGAAADTSFSGDQDSLPAAVAALSAPSPQPSGGVRNYKGEILEFCQKKRLAPPVFTVTSSGPTNDARFKCVAQWNLGEEIPTVVFEGARTKKEAEAGASKLLLAEVGLN